MSRWFFLNERIKRRAVWEEIRKRFEMNICERTRWNGIQSFRHQTTPVSYGLLFDYEKDIYFPDATSRYN